MQQRLDDGLRSLDEAHSLRAIHRKLQVLAKALIVATFAEDALRMLFTYELHQTSMRQAGWTSPAAQSALPLVSFVVQMAGSILATCGRQEGCYLLLGWCVWHPIMYQQQTNWEFVLETITIMGGLVVLLSHFRMVAAGTTRREGYRLLPAKAAGTDARPSGADGRRTDALQAVGRFLICSVFVYHALSRVHGFIGRASDVFEQREGAGKGGKLERAVRAKLATEEGGLADWASHAAEAVLGVGLLCGVWLVLIGMRSRLVALALAALTALSACWLHPFWRARDNRPTTFPPPSNHLLTGDHNCCRYYMLRPADATYRLGGVAGMEGYLVDAFTMADHQRYFFFQTMSTVGALLLLVVHGPGRHSVDEQHGPMVLPTTHDA